MMQVQLAFAVVMISGTVLADAGTLPVRQTNSSDADLSNTPRKGFFSWITGKENYPSEKVMSVVESIPSVDKIQYDEAKLKLNSSDKPSEDFSQDGQNKTRQETTTGEPLSSEKESVEGKSEDTKRQDLLEGKIGPSNRKRVILQTNERHLPPDWETWMRPEVLPQMFTEEPIPEEGNP